jgi:hypothetical protein
LFSIYHLSVPAAAPFNAPQHFHGSVEKLVENPPRKGSKHCSATALLQIAHAFSTRFLCSL